jgi:prolyl-tRNA synthetase
MSKLFVQTLREFPSDAEVISHKMLARAGYIRKLASGIYNYLPLMWRVLRKVETIVREEMDAAGAQELLMPFVQPRELWDESGRWDVYGKELMRLKDRHNREMCLGPTHEEVITAIARDGIKSYKQMPVNLYQIQSKFRDEVRPRYGLLRGREFIMKDAYSFDVDEAGLDKEYENMARAYTRIFERCGLETKMVQSDSGAIGGSVSHEFMVITDQDSGEDTVLYCENCDYAANSERAVSKLEIETTRSPLAAGEHHTPDIKSIEDLAKHFDVETNVILKSVVYIADRKPVIAYIRGDREIQETKLKNVLGANEIRLASNAEIEELGLVPGFIGPGTDANYVADNSVKSMSNFVIGANKKDYHVVGDARWSEYHDIGLAKENDSCVNCGSALKVTSGIEVGNIFKLGTKYSKPMNAVFLDENGKTHPYVMGCYGIGISRTAAAAVEAHHDEFGIKWPTALAPYQAVIVPVSAEQMQVAEKLYQDLQAAGIEVVLDDRDERPGVKFKDADLIGFPFRITVGKTMTEGKVEFKTRATGEMITITPKEVEDAIRTRTI